jgi:hypothetical protein
LNTGGSAEPPGRGPDPKDVEKAALAAIAATAVVTATITSTPEKADPGFSSDYRETFFKAHPEMRGQVRVHHAIEQNVLINYPGLFTEAEMHSLGNLRGIPNNLNSRLHLSSIRREWNAFYRTHPTATRQEIIDKARSIDQIYGWRFTPPVY